MAKDPAFLFYPGDWNLGTMHLTLLQKGCYMELLILQFAKGKFTEAQAKHMLNGSFEVAWPTLREKFNTDGTFFWNERLKLEKEKRQKFTESRRNNGSIKKEDKKNDKHMPKHMEDKNENTISSVVSMPTMDKDDFDNFKIKILRDILFIEPLMMNRGIKTSDDLDAWVTMFHIHIVGEGSIDKNYSEYRKHFKNWIMKQNTFEKPPKGAVKKMVI